MQPLPYRWLPFYRREVFSPEKGNRYVQRSQMREEQYNAAEAQGHWVVAQVVPDPLPSPEISVHIGASVDLDDTFFPQKHIPCDYAFLYREEFYRYHRYTYIQRR